MGADIEGVFIDTSAWIDAFRDENSAAAATIGHLTQQGQALTGGPVLFEILRGLRPDERRRVVPLLDAIPRLPFTEKDWTEAGALDMRLRSRGTTLPRLDVLIAHICLKNALPIYTPDRHFDAVPGLALYRSPLHRQ
ncbi:PIN domain-containing protein [bacterium]|nr:PIN domain-containing protein [bacterium]